MLTLLAQAPDRGLPAPDAVIYLELSVEDAMARGGFGEERYERVQAPGSQRVVLFSQSCDYSGSCSCPENRLEAWWFQQNA